MKVLITGATGLVGKELGIELVRRGHQVAAVSRDGARARIELPFPCEVIEGDLGRGPLPEESLAGVDAVVHLMGEPVAEGRWTEEKKRKILESRREGTRNLVRSLKGTAVKVLVSASAVGFYGDRGEEELNEDSARGGDFLASVCQDWEKEARAAPSGVRVALLRLGVVLSAQGGAFRKMLPPFQWGLGGRLGDGRAWMSWIHLQDVVGLLCWSLETESVRGEVNAVSPEPVRNAEFTQRLTASLGKTQGPPVPEIALRLAFGEMSGVVLASQKVFPARALEGGYRFRFPKLSEALAECASFFQEGDSALFSKQYLPFRREEVFPFFAEARNLERITPSLLNFRITGMSTPEIGEGTLIDYRLKVRGVPLGWRTRIEEWRPPDWFTDVQLKGPYAKWHHTHRFEDLGEGTLMTDIVRYRLPFGPLGAALAGGMVARDVGRIFDYRREICSREDFRKVCRS